MLVLVFVVWSSALVLISAYFELVFANFALVWFWVLMLVLVLVFMMVVWFCVRRDLYDFDLGVFWSRVWVSGFEVVVCFVF